jgi:hypothetical protein
MNCNRSACLVLLNVSSYFLEPKQKADFSARVNGGRSMTSESFRANTVLLISPLTGLICGDLGPMDILRDSAWRGVNGDELRSLSLE